MNHNELTNHINNLRRRSPQAEPNITWNDWFRHCHERSDYAAERLRHHRLHPNTGSGELITWGVIAASLADNNPRVTPWLGRHLGNLWEVACTPSGLNRDLHPVDHLLKLADGRSRGTHSRQHHRQVRVANALATQPIVSRQDPTAAAVIAKDDLTTLSQHCAELTGHDFATVTDLALSSGNNAEARQQLHRSRQRLQNLVAA